MDSVEWTVFLSDRLLSGDRTGRRPVAVRDSREVVKVDIVVLERSCNGESRRCTCFAAVSPHLDAGVDFNGVSIWQTLDTSIVILDD